MSLPSTESLNDIILSIYRAAERPELWPAVLRRMQDLLQGSGVTLLHHEHGANRRSVEAYSGLTPDIIELYARQYQAHDPWGQALTPSLTVPERVVDGSALVSDAIVRRSTYYNEFGRRIGSGRSAFSSLEPVGTRIAMVVVGRDLWQPPFEGHTLAALGALTPHLRQALRIHRRLSELDADQRSTTAALDGLSMGVLLVDPSRRVSFANREARRILELADALTLSDGQLKGLRASTTKAIRDAVAAVLDTSVEGRVLTPPPVLLVERATSQRPYRLLFAPASSSDGGGHRAVVYISDPLASVAVDPAVLQVLYSFTPTESVIAARLAEGLTLAEIARQLRMKVTTARWHAKRILAKAEVTSQTQLVSQVLRGPAMMKR